MNNTQNFSLRSARFRVAPAGWRSELRARMFCPSGDIDKRQLFRVFRQLNRFYARLDEQDWDFCLTKSDIAHLQPQPRSPGLYSATTSGTTGDVTTVFYSPEEYRFKSELLYRPLDLYDLPTTTNQVIFLDIDEACRGPMIEQRGKRQYRSFLASASAGIKRQMIVLHQIRPEVLRGFPSAMAALAESVPRRELRTLGVRYLSPSGETLPLEWRTLLADAFGGRVLDRYGATETGAIGWQCPICDAYHANTDEHVLETSATGSLLVTPLFLVTQPLYRYDLGDCVEILDPDDKCAVRLHKLIINQARRDDWLIDVYGARVSPLVFNFEQFGAVRTWKVHQDASGGISVSVTGDGIDASYLDCILDHVRKKVVGRVVCAEADPFRKRPGQGKFKRVSSEILPTSASSDGVRI